MILIADSGSTKADWRLIDDQKKVLQFSTQGINPYFLNVPDISSLLKTELVPSMPAVSGLNIYFYGAGCRAADKKETVKKALREVFPGAMVSVETDMLGAARSLCGHEPGIAAILGTGANTCYYDGTKIVENRTSSGFILGDEGSGAHIGKTLISDLLNDELPEHLRKRFEDRFRLDKDMIIDAVYSKPLPNRFLAAFSKFVYQNLNEQYMVDLVRGCFEEFFEKQVCRYPKIKELRLNCTGSVAFYFSNILRAVADSKGVRIGTITESPIAGLTLYHTDL